MQTPPPPSPLHFNSHSPLHSKELICVQGAKTSIYSIQAMADNINFDIHNHAKPHPNNNCI